LPLKAAALLLVATAFAAGCGGEDEAQDTSPATPGCREVAPPGAREPAPRKPPTILLNTELVHTALVRTSCGEFTITLDPARSPRAVVSFATLANAGYFDGTYFHRVVPGFVIQGGDPTGTGGGGPGYSTVDTPPAGTTYTKGVVAMAKTSAEPRGTAGSQFFIVTADDAGLPADYAVIGKVTRGLDVVERIGTLGDPATELPTQPVVIDEILIARRER
jgi:peptidyl-prolyl cis-trans isomerase B (cyclophilin B)